MSDRERWTLCLNREVDCEVIKEILQEILPSEKLDWDACNKDWKPFLNVYLFSAISSFAKHMGQRILGDVEEAIHSSCDKIIYTYTSDFHSSPPKKHNAGCMVRHEPLNHFFFLSASLASSPRIGFADSFFQRWPNGTEDTLL